MLLSFVAGPTNGHPQRNPSGHIDHRNSLPGCCCFNRCSNPVYVIFSNILLFQVFCMCHQNFNTCMCIITPGSCIVRDASGNVNDTVSSQLMANCSDAACKFGYDFSACKSEKDGCRFGLQNDFQV